MTILLRKAYLVKVPTKGGISKNMTTLFVDAPKSYLTVLMFLKLFHLKTYLILSNLGFKTIIRLKKHKRQGRVFSGK